VPNDGTTGFFRVMNSATTTVMPMSIVLGGAFEKPNAVNTPATGRGTISLEGNTLAFDIKYSGLTANANNMHIHGFATTADSVGVIHDLKSFNTPATLGTQGRIAGSVTLTEEQKTRLLAGDTYVNIHSTANTPGEIRGQITPAILRATLNGANERPAIDSPATGTGTFTLVGDELFMDVSYTGLRGAISNAHIHGPADSNTSAGVLVGGVYPDLHVGPVAGSTAGRFVGRLTLTPAQINAVIDGLSYFNIHSAFAGGGEIRGQIVP
jgi:trimeric autotransporter adhesin